MDFVLGNLLLFILLKTNVMSRLVNEASNLIQLTQAITYKSVKIVLKYTYDFLLYDVWKIFSHEL